MSKAQGVAQRQCPDPKTAGTRRSLHTEETGAAAHGLHKKSGERFSSPAQWSPRSNTPSAHTLALGLPCARRSAGAYDLHLRGDVGHDDGGRAHGAGARRGGPVAGVHHALHGLDVLCMHRLELRKFCEELLQLLPGGLGPSSAAVQEHLPLHQRHLHGLREHRATACSLVTHLALLLLLVLLAQPAPDAIAHASSNADHGESSK
mmetsp:Transcript_91808/g.259926  ORF Transcript_91808/g.259926 Transcript_91808/m.259926 type:complete len:205 (-) Transcript_91808:198-812(-)